MNPLTTEEYKTLVSLFQKLNTYILQISPEYFYTEAIVDIEPDRVIVGEAREGLLERTIPIEDVLDPEGVISRRELAKKKAEEERLKSREEYEYNEYLKLKKKFEGG